MANRVLHSDSVKEALIRKGWTQKDLANELGVSAQSVTNWLKGVDFPRPDKLLGMSTRLGMRLGDIAGVPGKVAADRPIVAFRRRAGTKTTDAHIERASAMGSLLEALVPHLPPLRALRTELPSPNSRYADLQRAAAQTRQKLGLGSTVPLDYSVLISEFAANDAFLIPVLWGQKKRHENALHIFLPRQRATFIYLNLDTPIEDFKFWMAHELGHVYTPSLAGCDEGEDFADAFAGALLFPEPLARDAYENTVALNRKHDVLGRLTKLAEEHKISLFSVYCEIRSFARAHKLTELPLMEADIHSIRMTGRGPCVSSLLFDALPPSPEVFVASAENIFRSTFFVSLKKMLRESGTGPAYVQQLMDIPLQDAVALHSTLIS